MTTDKGGNDTNVQSRAVVEILLVGGNECFLCSAVKSVLEEDGGVGARSKVESCWILEHSCWGKWDDLHPVEAVLALAPAVATAAALVAATAAESAVTVAKTTEQSEAEASVDSAEAASVVAGTAAEAAPKRNRSQHKFKRMLSHEILTSCNSDTGGSGRDFCRSSVINEKVLRENTSSIGIIRGVASVSLSGRVTDSARSESSGEKSFLGISTNRSKLLGKCENNSLVTSCCSCGGGILMLLNSLNLGVHSSLVANDRSETNCASISLKRSIHQRIRLTGNISSRLRVGESLIRSSLMKAVEVRDRPGSSGSRCVSEQTEDRILNVVRVVESQVHANTIEESIVGVFLGDFTASKHGFRDREAEGILGFGDWHRSSRSNAKEGEEVSCGLVLHDVGQIVNDCECRINKKDRPGLD